MRLLILFNFIIIPCVCCQEIQFIKEDISFWHTKEYLKTDGYYWLSNPSTKAAQVQIFFPFGYKGDLIKVDSIEVFNMTTGMAQEISDRTDLGFSFLSTLPARDTIVYRITYRQNIIGDSVKYILRSTQQWGKPLVLAEYKLILNYPAVLTNCSYKADTMYSIEQKKIYYWKRTNFMPENDLVFHFKLH